MSYSIRRGFTQNFLRWPLLLIVLCILFFELFLYIVLRVGVRIYESIWTFLHRTRSLRKELYAATTFDQWLQTARRLDQMEEREQWKQTPESPFYDYQLLQDNLITLKKLRANNDLSGLMKELLYIYSRHNFGGIHNRQLWSETHFGTKALVHEFLQEVQEATILIRDHPSLSLDDKIQFFRRAKRAYGRTALILSGGAALGYFHIGVLKALYESKTLPHVMCGASAGSLISAFVCCRTEEELVELFRPEIYSIFTACEEPFWVKAKRYVTKGHLFDVNLWREKLKLVTKGDTTFLEAFKRTGRVLNISTTSVSPYVPATVLNAFNAPNVVIWSAVLASSAFPRIIEPVEFIEKDPKTGALTPFHTIGKKWSDGTIKNDIPIREISKLYDSNFIVVSQVNPHTAPFFYNLRGSDGSPSTHSIGSRMRGGFVVATIESFLKLEMKKWLHLLGEMDLLPTMFGQDIRTLFLQPTSGTVTIVPRATLIDYWRIITDPTYESMKSYILRGERATWPSLARISSHFNLESLIESSYKMLCARDTKEGIRRVRRRESEEEEEYMIRRISSWSDSDNELREMDEADDDSSPPAVSPFDSSQIPSYLGSSSSSSSSASSSSSSTAAASRNRAATTVTPLDGQDKNTDKKMPPLNELYDGTDKSILPSIAGVGSRLPLHRKSI